MQVPGQHSGVTSCTELLDGTHGWHVAFFGLTRGKKLPALLGPSWSPFPEGFILQRDES